MKGLIVSEVLQETPRRVRYTAAAQLNRRHLVAGLLIALAVLAVGTQWPPALGPLIPWLPAGIGMLVLFGIAWLIHEANLHHHYRLLRDGKVIVGTVIARRPTPPPQDDRYQRTSLNDDWTEPQEQKLPFIAPLYTTFDIKYVFAWPDGKVETEIITLSEAFLNRWVLGDKITLLADPARRCVIPYGLIQNVEIV